MNRRHFFALSWPVLLGRAASAVSAQDNRVSKPRARRVRVELSYTKTGGSPQNIRIATNAGVETYVAFLPPPPSGGEAETSASQAIAPYLRVTPQVEADGKITVLCEAQFGKDDTKITTASSAENGKKQLAATITFGDVREELYVTATLLDPPQRI